MKSTMGSVSTSMRRDERGKGREKREEDKK
jgi:hypothetical protein